MVGDKPGRILRPRFIAAGASAGGRLRPVESLSAKEGRQRAPDDVGHDFVAGGVGVETVGEVHLGDSADAFEEERDEGGVVGFGERGEDGGEVADVGFAHARRHRHAGDDDLGGGIFGADFVDDALEVFLRDGRGESAEAVVAAEFEDEDVHGRAEDPIDAAEAAGGGFTAEAGVDHAVVEAGVGDLFLDESGEGFGGGVVEAVAGGEAVAEEENGFRGRLGGGERGETEGDGKKEGKDNLHHVAELGTRGLCPGSLHHE